MSGKFHFNHLNAEVRKTMLAEIELDIRENVLTPSKHFTVAGAAGYPALLQRAAAEYDESWLASQLRGAFNKKEIIASGAERDVRRDQHELFAGSEFNRFYVRGICRHAIDNGQTAVRIYRARASQRPRPESEAKIGILVDPNLVLADLRSKVGTSPEFGLPEVNSGLSLELL
ncbi:MAG: hypothetical protein IV100_26560 [Myxococcales bacterium]|nr:hypothetical protein [Myxococcales bacterium]